MVQSWICNSLSLGIKHSVIFMEYAYDVWKDLRLRFSQGDFVRIAKLQHELYTCQQPSKSVSDFFTELRILWEELENYRPLRECICPKKCACAFQKDPRAYREQDYVMRFLMGLNESFDAVRSQILLMDPLPEVTRVFSMVIQHERQYEVTATSSDSHAFVNLAEGRKYTGRGKTAWGSKQCSYCGKTGHTVETCYKKHGLPPWLKDKSYSSKANNTVAEEDRDRVDDLNDKPIAVEKHTIPELSNEECRTLLTLLQKSGF